MPIAASSTAAAQADLLNHIRVRVVHEVPIKTGAEVDARTVEDFYVHNDLVLPKGTLIVGQVRRVTPVSRRVRLAAMSHGDFTALRTPEIRFTEVRLADGRDIPIKTDIASSSSQTVRLVARQNTHTSVFRKAWTTLIGRKDQAVATITSPGKKDRAEEYLFSQLPWHPQEIEDGTVFDVLFDGNLPIAPTTHSAIATEQAVQKDATLEARLQTPLDSRSARQNDPVIAVVTSPQIDADHRVRIPQGSLLFGRVVAVHPARRFGRNGALRFNFEKLQLPEGYEQQVTGVPSAIDSAQGREIVIDAEGGVQPPSNKSVLAPLALTLLSASALHEDEAPLTHATAASNGFGLATRIIGITTRSNIFGGVIGAIASARMVYSRFIAHGKDVHFANATGIEVDLGATRTPLPRPNAMQR